VPPSKLPAIILFKQNGEVKDIVEYPETRKMMLRSTTTGEFVEAMNEFVRA